MEKYQTFWRRVGASILDSFILAPVSWIIALVFILVDSSPAMTAVSSALVGIISVFYNILTHNLYGQTVGKLVAKVKVLDDSEKSINFGQAVLRSFPQLIIAMFAVSFSTADKSAADSARFIGTIIYWLFGLFLVADVIICLSNEKHRALHDFIAGTVVVKTDV
jgi:uncharacterized RDD family membrane protein YckC